MIYYSYSSPPNVTAMLMKFGYEERLSIFLASGGSGYKRASDQSHFYTRLYILPLTHWTTVSRPTLFIVKYIHSFIQVISIWPLWIH